VSDFQEECKNCGEPICFGSPDLTAPIQRAIWLHERDGSELCRVQQFNGARAEKCDHDWYESEVGCEDCGSHTAFRCSECNMVIDTVWGSDPRDEEDR
jgi:hypothetical protein